MSVIDFPVMHANRLINSIVVLTGAGVSAESGIKTFRSSDGLWENHRIEDVATPEAFQRNPHLVYQFYNERRRLLRARQHDLVTVERVGAEVSIYQPDMFWIDYITLMKAPGVGRDGNEDHTTVKALSNGIKQIAMRNRCVGGASAQVNRESIKAKAFLPRVENIAYGDAIGQDADGVVSINRQGAYLYYALVKHRGGPEIGKTKVQFMVDEGIIEEAADQDDEDDDDD